MNETVVRTSTIFVGVGKKTKVYRSLSEVPGGVKKQLEHSTRGANSATILIADRRGRDHVMRALKGMPSAVESRLADSIAARRAKKREPEEPMAGEPLAWYWRWLMAIFPCGAAIAAYILGAAR